MMLIKKPRWLLSLLAWIMFLARHILPSLQSCSNWPLPAHCPDRLHKLHWSYHRKVSEMILSSLLDTLAEAKTQILEAYNIYIPFITKKSVLVLLMPVQGNLVPWSAAKWHLPPTQEQCQDMLKRESKRKLKVKLGSDFNFLNKKVLHSEVTNVEVKIKLC